MPLSSTQVAQIGLDIGAAFERGFSPVFERTIAIKAERKLQELNEQRERKTALESTLSGLRFLQSQEPKGSNVFGRYQMAIDKLGPMGGIPPAMGDMILKEAPRMREAARAKTEEADRRARLARQIGAIERGEPLSELEPEAVSGALAAGRARAETEAEQRQRQQNAALYSRLTGEPPPGDLGMSDGVLIALLQGLPGGGGGGAGGGGAGDAGGGVTTGDRRAQEQYESARVNAARVIADNGGQDGDFGKSFRNAFGVSLTPESLASMVRGKTAAQFQAELERGAAPGVWPDSKRATVRAIGVDLYGAGAIARDAQDIYLSGLGRQPGGQGAPSAEDQAAVDAAFGGGAAAGGAVARGAAPDPGALLGFSGGGPTLRNQNMRDPFASRLGTGVSSLGTTPAGFPPAQREVDPDAFFQAFRDSVRLGQ